jgi:phosphohistidine phosphatase SixA
MRLYLLRHGDVLERGDDVHRELSASGEEQAADVAAFLASLNITPDKILTSPLERAKAAGAIVGRRLRIKNISTTEFLVPGANERQLVEELNRKKLESVMCVGHEPQLRSFISYLTTGSRSAPIEIRKSSLACVEIPYPLAAGRGILIWLVTIDQMREATAK